MSVYVDQLPGSGWGKWNGGGHLLASSLEELHAMARELGLKRAWFQDRRYPHYDLTASKRALAIQAGAIEFPAGRVPDPVLVRCPEGGYQTRGEQRAQTAERRAAQLQSGGSESEAAG